MSLKSKYHSFLVFLSKNYFVIFATHLILTTQNVIQFNVQNQVNSITNSL